MRNSSPNAAGFQAAYVTGFRRSFGKWDEQGFTGSNLDVGHIPHCALDVQPHPNDSVNGVVFMVDEKEFQKLIEREYGYNVIKTTAYDFDNGQELGVTYLFSAKQPQGTYDFSNNAAQERYLQVCLEGAKTMGDTFYRSFVASTYSNARPLNQEERLQHLL